MSINIRRNFVLVCVLTMLPKKIKCRDLYIQYLIHQIKENVVLLIVTITVVFWNVGNVIYEQFRIVRAKAVSYICNPRPLIFCQCGMCKTSLCHLVDIWLWSLTPYLQTIQKRLVSKFLGFKLWYFQKFLQHVARVKSMLAGL